MGIFSKLSDVKPIGSSKFFHEGLYIVKITKIEASEKRKGETVIITGEVAAVVSDRENAPGVGATGAQIIVFGTGDQKEMAQRNLMQFLCSVYGGEPKDRSDAEWEAIAKSVTDDGALNGYYLVLETWDRPNKSNEGVFTVHNWKGIATEEDFAAFGMEVPADFYA